MLFITPVHLLLLTNRGTEGIPLSRFDFSPLVFFRGVVCLTRTIIFMLNSSPAFCTGSFHLLPPAWPRMQGPELTGGAVQAHAAVSFFPQTSFSPSEKAPAVGRTLILCLYRERFLRDADLVDPREWS